MNKIIVTRADANIKAMSDITHPILKKYAKDCGADFHVFEDYDFEGSSLYRIMECGKLLETYDRLLHLDTDMLILKNCANLFEIVPEDKIGVVFEDRGSRREDRLNRIKNVQTLRKDVGWKTGYLNAACLVISKTHKSIFETEERYNDLGYEGVELGYQIYKQGYADDLFELSHSFNFMSMWAEPWFGAKKSEASILHYAGNGFNSFENSITQIKHDYLLLKKYGLLYE